jgi:hypothetical protein
MAASAASRARARARSAQEPGGVEKRGRCRSLFHLAGLHCPILDGQDAAWMACRRSRPQSHPPGHRGARRRRLSRGAFDLRHVAIPQLLAPGAHRGSGVPRKLVYCARRSLERRKPCSSGGNLDGALRVSNPAQQGLATGCKRVLRGVVVRRPAKRRQRALRPRD